MAIPAAEQKAIEKALKKFDKELRSQPDWAAWESNRSHKFAIRAEGKLYPAKKIVSLATGIAVRDFTGGRPTNGYLRARGFEIVDLRESPRLEFVKGNIYDRKSEIHAPFGGSFQSGIAPSDKAPAVFLFTGSSGEQYGYRDEMDAHGVYSYTGEGQVGDMTLTRGNLAIQRHAKTGRALYLFKALEKRKGQQYIGEFACADISWKDGPDRNGNIRKVLIFHLVPVMDLLAHEEGMHDDSQADSHELKTEILRNRAYEAAVASPSKSKVTAIRTVHARSQTVKEYVLRRAEGICESCKQAAPFITKNGKPYLEPHHINRLSDGGLDHPLFIAALCPACHKEIHYGTMGEQKNEALRQIVSTKESPYL
ncbi:HNH endonuclease [Pseudomonas coronafaciens pv. oryzae]|uniref:HNH endonuclease n=1 Tax=Pseudomonas coronafaciens TaxID=53409 RepID=UPI0006CD83A3|nr:HNH endonuclease signature motif containing protein [Pseudomonas coronafaciens]KPB54265.1 HNH endonuclease [Pseudomonas coronafaciens pv. oryzae]KPY07853.1 HNH endonuclease [Pseudomonas coronafaciens pv. oryzae]RMS98815.1 HNH endonuclease [Pseudomonas coronafaciens pv. oryzae]